MLLDVFLASPRIADFCNPDTRKHVLGSEDRNFLYHANPPPAHRTHLSDTATMSAQARASWGMVRICLGSGFAAFTGSIFINDNIIEVNGIDGDSMAPSLCRTYHETGQGEQVLFNKWTPRKDLKRGDVVSFSPPHKPDGLSIKRIVALEGDWVTLDYKRRPSDERRRGEHDEAKRPVTWDAIGEKREYGFGTRRVRVPFGHVWVEGDNIKKSHDSNFYGPVSFCCILRDRRQSC